MVGLNKTIYQKKLKIRHRINVVQFPPGQVRDHAVKEIDVPGAWSRHLEVVLSEIEI